MIVEFWMWGGFGLFVLAMLALDLGAFHRQTHSVGFKEALTWTGIWVLLAVLFGAGVGYFWGMRKAVEFYTGYLIELSLSADNVFVFVLIFTYFAVPARYHHKVLFWGVLGALAMRMLMIVVGVSLIHRFSWILYLFGGFLVFTGLKMSFSRQTGMHPEKNLAISWFTRLIPLTCDYHGDRFFARVNGKTAATPLLVVLLGVEVSDLIFALDSIPAILAVTLDPFIVYTSNVFAIMGLRSMYFVLAGAVHKFVYLRTALGLVLGFVGVKMLLAETRYKIDTIAALGIITATLGAGLLASWVHNRRRSSSVSERG